MEKIEFLDPESGEKDQLYVLEQTSVGGVTYLLVTYEEDGDSDALILKQKGAEEEGNVTYDIVDDDRELEAISKIFMEILDDTLIE